MNPDLPECQRPECVENPDLENVKPGYCIPEDPDCIPICDPPNMYQITPKVTRARNSFPKGTMYRKSGGGTIHHQVVVRLQTVNLIGAEVSNCRIDGNTHGIQQKFNPVRYQACGLYPNAQLAYTDGFVAGCTQVGNTQQLCQAFVVMNTQQTQTAAATQPITQSTTQPTQTLQSTQAIQPAAVS